MNKYIMIIALVLFSTNVMANDTVTTVTTWLQIKSLIGKKNATQD